MVHAGSKRIESKPVMRAQYVLRSHDLDRREADQRGKAMRDT